jgi:hypothetical protein
MMSRFLFPHLAADQRNGAGRGEKERNNDL